MDHVWRTLLLSTTLVAAAGCITNEPREPREITGAEINRKEQWDTDAFPLNRQWDVYRKNMDQLLGGLIVVMPSQTESNGVTAAFLGRISTEAARTNVQNQVLDEVLYASKVAGDFAANVSFGFGRISVTASNLYDLNLRESNGATIPPDMECIDLNRLKAVTGDIPDKFYAVIFATGIKHAVLTSRSFTSVSGNGEASYSLIKVDGKYYTSDEKTQINHVLITVGINKSSSFGTFDPATKMYKKKPAERVSFETPVPKGDEEKGISADEVRRILAHHLSPPKEQP